MSIFQNTSNTDPMPDGCAIIAELMDVPNPIPGWDSGSGGDIMESVIKSVTFIRDHEDPKEVRRYNIAFNDAGQIIITEHAGEYIHLKVGDGSGGGIFTKQIIIL